MKNWIIYGATGYSGRLIAQQAKNAGARPTLAGRDEAKLRALGGELGLPWKCFSLDDAAALTRNLGGLQAVLHCAGPFSRTSRAMADACLEAGAHYLDISGEIPVFEAVYARHSEALRRGISLIPGVGCDVVPSNYLADALLSRLPDAVELDLVCSAKTHPSRGTMKTAVEMLPLGGRAVRGGELMRVPHGKYIRKLGRISAMSVPLADVASAHRLGRVRNITVYLALPHPLIWAARAFAPLTFLSGASWTQRMLKNAVGAMRDGTSEERNQGRLTWHGEARNSAGQRVSGEASIPDPYVFTAVAAVEAAKRACNGAAKPGAWAPAQALGPDFFTSLPNCKMRIG